LLSNGSSMKQYSSNSPNKKLFQNVMSQSILVGGRAQGENIKTSILNAYDPREHRIKI